MKVWKLSEDGKDIVRRKEDNTDELRILHKVAMLKRATDDELDNYMEGGSSLARRLCNEHLLIEVTA